MSTERFVYFIRPVGQVGPIKIGVANDPKLRLARVAAWSPLPLEIITTIPGTAVLERNLHECFAFAHLRGEWFSPVEGLQRGIFLLTTGHAVERAFDLNARTGSIRKRNPNNTARFTPAFRERQSYRLRICNARRRLKFTGAAGDDAASGILHFTKSQIPLTSDEKRQLNDYLAVMSRSLQLRAFSQSISYNPTGGTHVD